MRLNEPRIYPKEPESWSDAESKQMAPFVADGADMNIFKTLLQHPNLMRRWMVFANHVLFKSSLPIREKELIILRIGFLCQAGYEWAQHVQIALKGGLDSQGIRSAKEGPDMIGISEVDKLLLQATDELHSDAFISDETWAGLAKHFSQEQLMDIVFTVGQYNLVSMALNSFGVQLDAGIPGEGLSDVKL